jgi:hypothetical protein
MPRFSQSWRRAPSTSSPNWKSTSPLHRVCLYGNDSDSGHEDGFASGNAVRSFELENPKLWLFLGDRPAIYAQIDPHGGVRWICNNSLDVGRSIQLLQATLRSLVQEIGISTFYLVEIIGSSNLAAYNTYGPVHVFALDGPCGERSTARQNAIVVFPTTASTTTIRLVWAP